MATALGVVAGLFLLLAVLLAIPITFGFSASVDAPNGRWQRSARLQWAFGLLNLPIGGQRPKTKPPKKPPGKATKAKRSRLKVGRLLANPAFWARLRLLLSRLLGAIEWQMLHLHARFGLDDPADTGRLWGLAGPMAASLLPAGRDVSIQPDFERETLAVESEGEFRVVPLRVVGIVLAFGLSPRTWRVVWPAVRW